MSVKEIKMWETSNGKQFLSLEEAQKYEAHWKEVEEAAELVLPEKYDTCDFSNGGGYILISPERVSEFHRRYEAIVKKYDGKERAEIFSKCGPKGIIGRYLCDGDSLTYTLFGLASRLSGNKLYGQAYFVAHPYEVKDVCIAELK